MSVTYTVFLPNKSRYKLEISKHSPLYQGLEKVCTEKGLLPTHDFVFRYNKTYPDLGTPVGMLNLSNLTELELVPASEAPARQSGADTVSVALQYGSQRYTETCNCDTSLWDVIAEFGHKHPEWIPDQQTQPAGDHPVLVYMRQEVPGEPALRGTSLRQLGIQPGGPAVLLRLLHRPVPLERLEAAAAAVEARRKQPAPASAPRVTETVAASAHTTVTATNVATSSSAVRVAATERPSQPPAEEAVSLFSPFREVPREPPPPPPQSYREPRTLAEALNLPSFENFQPPGHQTNQQRPAAAAVAFGPDRPFRFPEETAGRDLYRNELADVRQAEFAPCDRRLCAYVAGGGAAGGEEAETQRPGAPGPAASLEEPDDSFFNLTESDMRRMMADLKRRVDDEMNGPLLTRQQREQRREDLYSGYEHSVVRLFFPDRRVVQATFRPRETVFTLYKFVRTELLTDSEADFFLYTTPPKKEIADMAQFLIQADLVPMPIVYVGFRTPMSEGQAILKPEVSAAIGTRESCDKVALSCMRSAVEPLYAAQQARQGSAPAAAQSSGSSAGPSSTVPKWFKK